MSKQNKPCFESLEDRVLLSATAFESDIAVLSNVNNSQDTEPSVVINEILVIDESIDNFEELLERLNKPQLEIHLIDSTKNGLEQISTILAQYENLEALHLVSHGSDAQIQLGNSLINSQTLSEESILISQWSNSFSEKADILIYGCELAASSAGQDFIKTLAQISHTDVAASDDITGLGGDAELEYEVGSIEAKEALNQSDYETLGISLNNAPVLNQGSEAKFSVARYNYSPNALPESPEFSSTPIYVGLVDEISDPPANGGSDFALHFQGYIEITTAGDYEFSTRSDDGSDLYINGVKVVDNDGLHGARTRTGTINLTAGLHKIDVLFFENGGGDNLSVSYSGADTGNVASAISAVASQAAFDIAYSLEGTEPTGSNPSLSSDANNNLLTKVTDDGTTLKVGTVQGSGSSRIVANTSLEAGASQTIPVTLLDEGRNSYTISVTVNPDGSYTASDLAQLKDGLTARGFFSFDVVDEAGLSTGTYRVAIAITGSNVIPVITDLPSGETDEDTLSGTLTGLSFTDADGDSLTYISQNNTSVAAGQITSPVTLSNVRVTLNSLGQFTVTGDGFDQLRAGQSAIIDFNIRLTDGSFISSPQSIQIEVTGVNDVPALSTVSGASFTASRYTYTPNILPEIPSFPGTPTSVTEVSEIADPATDDGSDFAIHFEGYIEILTAGTYTFRTASDDGSDLYINSNKVVDNDGLHGLRTRSGAVNLSAGIHKIDVLFFENRGGDRLITAYSGPDTSNTFQAIPAARAEIATAYTVNATETAGSNSIIEFDPANGLLKDAFDIDGDKQSIGTIQGKDGEVQISNNSTETTIQQIIEVELKDQFNNTYIVDVTVKSDGSYSISNIDPIPEAALAKGSFTFSIVDEEGAESETYEVILNITGKNDIAALSRADISLTEGDIPVTASGTLTVNDLDNENKFISYNRLGTLGELNLLSDGSYTFTANSTFRELTNGQSLSETFNVLSVDGTVTSIRITINGVSNSVDSIGNNLAAELNNEVGNNAESEFSASNLETRLQELLPPSFFDFVVTESGLDLSTDVSDDFLVVLERAFALRPIESAEIADSADETEYRGNFYDSPALSPTEIQFIESLLKNVKQFEEQKVEEADQDKQVNSELAKFDFVSALENEIQIADRAELLTQYQLDQRKTLSQTFNRNFDTFS